ncbi:hypothetical protein ACTPD5_22195, partial [Clostridioides difficile]|uniref:hypothetical protein n=1 Tax=Clostridioides difficile TaxID=1496 RepID=UPI003F8D278F
FAVDTVDAKKVVSPEFKKADSKVVMLCVNKAENDVVDFEELKLIEELPPISTVKVLANLSDQIPSTG